MKRRGIILIRVSSRDQAKEGYSIPGQRRWAEKTASSNEIELPHEPIILEGISAKNFPVEWEKVEWLIQEDKNLTDVLVIDLDRIGREASETICFILRLLRKGITIVTKEREYAPDELESKLIAYFKSVFAEQEIKQLSERTQRGKKEKFMAKKWVHGYVPRFYKRKGDWIERMPEYKNVVRDIFREFENTRNFSKVVRVMRDRHKIGLTNAQVKAILKNPVYIGRPRYKEAEVHDPDLTMIPEELFRRVQRVIEDKTKKTKKASEKSWESLQKEYGVGYTMRCVPQLRPVCSHCGAEMKNNGNKIVNGINVQNYLCPNPKCRRQGTLPTGAQLNHYRKLNLMTCPYCRETESFIVDVTHTGQNCFTCRECGGKFYSEAKPNKYLRRYAWENEPRENYVKLEEGPVASVKQETLDLFV